MALSTWIASFSKWFSRTVRPPPPPPPTGETQEAIERITALKRTAFVSKVPRFRLERFTSTISEVISKPDTSHDENILKITKVMFLIAPVIQYEIFRVLS